MTEETIETEDFSDLSNYTIQIALSTLPYKNPIEFNEKVVNGFYHSYRENNKENFVNDKKEINNHYYYDNDTTVEVLYNPIRYYMFGNYDIAYIALIDNFKFAQRIFEPKNLCYPHNSQNIIGITENNPHLKQFFYDRIKGVSKQYFVGITNIKLNNGILLGNGMDFYNLSVFYLQKTIKEFNDEFKNEINSKIEFQIIQSFSWFEITLLTFCDNPEYIYNLVKRIRGLEIKDIEKEDKSIIMETPLYRSLFENESLENVNLIADTQTQIGIHADLVEKDIDDDFVQQFLNDDSIKLSTEIEWQIRPGHLHTLIELFNRKVEEENQNYGLVNLNLKKIFIISGKGDYYIQEGTDEKQKSNKNNNLHLFRLTNKEYEEIFQHVRNIRTRIYYKTESAPKPKKTMGFENKLEKLSFTNKKLNSLEINLKNLKISRLIRNKVYKMFSSFNQSIQDVILFPYFIDFRFFLDNFINDISEKEKIRNSEALEVKKIEKLISEKIKIYHDAYYLRVLNSYQFENYSDIDIDYNTSVQQILSSIGIQTHDLGSKLLKDENYGPIIKLDITDVEANQFAINYGVHHIFHPEFIYATLTKEILNYFEQWNDSYKQIIEKFNALELDDSKYNHFKNRGMIDPKRLITDLIRIGLPYENKIGLFNFWFWTYNFQNTSLYDSSGHFNENHFQNEMFRFVFVNTLYGKIFGINDKKIASQLVCPIPEMYSFWERNYNDISETVRNIIVKFEKNDRDGFAFFDEIRIVIDSIDLKSESKIVNTMHSYLYSFYNECEGKIRLLRRDWEDGKVLTNFLDAEGSGYFVDPTGGWFFSNTKALNSYFRKNCNELRDIWDYSTRAKKEIIETLIRKI